MKDWHYEKLFSRLLKNKTEHKYWEKIMLLRKHANDDVFEFCLKLLQSDEKRAKLIAFEVLAQLGIVERPYLEKSLPLFFNVLEKENDSKILSAALIAISANNNALTERDVKKIVHFKNHTNSDIRYSLTFALLHLTYKVAIETLIYLSKDTASKVRDWATYSLGQSDKNSPEIENALWLRVKDKHNDTRMEAIAGLAKRKSNGIMALINSELEKDNGSLLFEAIEVLGEKVFLPKLKQILSENEHQEGINEGWIEDLKNCIMALETL